MRLRSSGSCALLLVAVFACGGGKSHTPDAGRTRKALDSGPGSSKPASPSRDAGSAIHDAALSDDLDAGHEPAHDAAIKSSGNAGAGGSAGQPQLTSDTTCTNGLHDGHETDIDCGGADCGACLSGRHCSQASDCVSGECKGGACTCLPLTTCPHGACGTLRQCGSELECGSCASGVCYENLCCTPRACASGECGVFADGCGGTIRCGDESCCTPRTCDHPSLANRCGEFDDRCGGHVTCTCANSSASCYLGECCLPEACDDTTCGVATSNGCGGVTSCSCSAGKTCYNAQCCKPLDCSAFVGPGCSEMDDGCGGKVTCGCSTGQSCHYNTCCSPVGCAAGVEGDGCGPEVADGCGGTQTCSCMSGSGFGCYLGKCCAAKSCTAQGLDQRCGPNTDSCGGSLWCGCGITAGIHVTRRSNCGQACADTLAKVATCNASAALEMLDQTAGWDFPQMLSSSACSTGYGFIPNWSGCSGVGFQLDAQGFIYLDAGTHCFSITGRKLNSCGSLYFVPTPETFTGWNNLPSTTAATLTSGHAPVCFDLTRADYYPIRWHYTQDAGNEDFHVNYCAGGPTSCTPISSGQLYPALP